MFSYFHLGLKGASFNIVRNTGSRGGGRVDGRKDSTSDNVSTIIQVIRHRSGSKRAAARIERGRLDPSRGSLIWSPITVTNFST